MRASCSEGRGRLGRHNVSQIAEPEFVNILRSPGIDFQPGGPVRQLYFTYRPATDRLAESIPGLLKRLQIRALIL